MSPFVAAVFAVAVFYPVQGAPTKRPSANARTRGSVINKAPSKLLPSHKRPAKAQTKQKSPARVSAKPESLVNRLTRELYQAAASRIQYFDKTWAIPDSTHLVETTWVRADGRKVATEHNIEKTASLTSPYVGTVVLKYLSRTSQIMGESSEERAKVAAFSERKIVVIALSLAYQNNKWTFKRATRLPDEEAERIGRG